MFLTLAFGAGTANAHPTDATPSDGVGLIQVTIADTALGAEVDARFMCGSNIEFSSTDNAGLANFVCYLDWPTVTINPHTAAGGASICETTGGVGPDAFLALDDPGKDCGDGLDGTPPPAWNGGSGFGIDRYDPVNEREWSGTNYPVTYDNKGTGDLADDTMFFQGCFGTNDPGGVGNPAGFNNVQFGPYWWLQVTIDYAAHPGVATGKFSAWWTRADCQDPDPDDDDNQVTLDGGPPALSPSNPWSPSSNLTLTEHADLTTGIATYDGDGDGCEDVKELTGTTQYGGRRDPLYRYDVNEVSGDQVINVGDDIIGTAARFGANDASATATPNRYSDPDPPIDTAAPAYDPAFDRGPSQGAAVGSWNRLQPDGTVNISDDILGVAGAFGMDCS